MQEVKSFTFTCPMCDKQVTWSEVGRSADADLVHIQPDHDPYFRLSVSTELVEDPYLDIIEFFAKREGELCFDRVMQDSF